MNHRSIKPYLKHYGKIRSLRGSVVRSTFKRVTAGFDNYVETDVLEAMEALAQEDLSLLRCIYCDRAASCWDHLVPAARGGTHQLRNLAPSCAKCNDEKGAKTWEEYLDDAIETERLRVARTLLVAYTANFSPLQPFVSDDDQASLTKILKEIHALMESADEIVAKALTSKTSA